MLGVYLFIITVLFSISGLLVGLIPFLRTTFCHLIQVNKLEIGDFPKCKCLVYMFHHFNKTEKKQEKKQEQEQEQEQEQNQEQ